MPGGGGEATLNQNRSTAETAGGKPSEQPTV